MTDTFLSPIEAPQGLVKKLAYYLTRKQFGRVPTPIKVHSARLPAAFGMFYGKIGRLDRRLTLPRELVFLIREQVARINVCEFCMDVGRWFSIKESMNQAGRAGDLLAPVTALLGTRDLRDCLARSDRTPLQPDQHRPEHSFRHAVRHHAETAGRGLNRHGKAVELARVVHQDATARRRVGDPVGDQIDQIAIVRHQPIVHIDVRPIRTPH